MEVGALLPYEQCLIDGENLLLRHGDGTVTSLDIERWLRPADDVDRAVLRAVVGPALDVGCGPGRIVEALTEQGVRALGIDIAPSAVTLARNRGAAAYRCDVFGPVPGEGTWRTVLLLDGNIGIGGNPDALLARVGELLTVGGTVVVETDGDPGTDLRGPVRFARAGRAMGPTFRWAMVGRHTLIRKATALGYRVDAEWTTQRRSFVTLGMPDAGR